MPMLDFSVLIVNYNTRQLLLDCLHSLVETTTGAPIEIWVADNGSTDGSVAAVQSSFPEVHLIANDNNLGFTKANNQILTQVHGDILVLLNPDTIILPGTFAALMQTFESDVSVGVIGPQLLNGNGSIQPSCGSFTSVWTEFLFQSFLFKVIPSQFPLGKQVHMLQRHRYQIKHEVDWVTGACLAIRKEVVNEIGLLDEGFFMYGEDMEWCWRAKLAGYKVIYIPAAKVIHFSRQASMQDYRSWIIRYTSGQLRFIDKIHSKIYESVFGLLICLGSLLRIVVWAGIRLVKVSRQEEAQQRLAGYCEAFVLGWHAVVGKPI
jgi:GT2 family glycosyltransferase